METELTNLPKLKHKDFQRLSEYIHTNLGVKMPETKKLMLQSRLQKRLQALNLKSFSDYCDYLFSPEGKEKELSNMIDVVTTHKTDFFREPVHYEILVNKALPAILNTNNISSFNPLRVWSSASSSGEEPYTLAMVLDDYKDHCGCFDYMILATDISQKMIDHGKKGIYSKDLIGPIPPHLKKKYLLKSKDKSRNLIRICSKLRQKVIFNTLNLLDEHYQIPNKLDIIFCRNVFIYFDLDTQKKILGRFYKMLKPGGFLFMGHSETIHSFGTKYVQIAPSVHRKPPQGQTVIPK